MAKAVFLDRDETINPDPGYINHPDHFDVYPWVPEGLAQLRAAGFKLVLITNQSGIGRGIIKIEQLEAIHSKMNRLLKEAHVEPFDLIEVCPHAPDTGCECRKPKPKLILDAAKKLNLDLTQCYLIGDRDTDVQAGINAGLKQSYKIQMGSEADFRSAVTKIIRSMA